MTLQDRLLSRIVVAESGCWLWTGCLSSGYGRIGIAGSDTGYAHRVSYELFVGPIPEGMVVDHTCHNATDCLGGKSCVHRRCVNPAHLECVTQGDNIRRSPQRGGKFRGRMTHCHQGHEFTPDNTRISSSGARVCRACCNARARKYQSARRQDNRRVDLAGLRAASPELVEAYTDNKPTRVLRFAKPKEEQK